MNQIRVYKSVLYRVHGRWNSLKIFIHGTQFPKLAVMSTASCLSTSRGFSTNSLYSFSSHSTSHIYLANFRIRVSLKLRTSLLQRSTVLYHSLSSYLSNPLPTLIMFISRALRTMHITGDLPIRDFALHCLLWYSNFDVVWNF